MKIYISVDIEGISGIYCKEQISPEGSRFLEGRNLVTQEINACITALKDAGATEVVVQDIHGGSYSFIYEKITPKVDGIISGVGIEERFYNLKEFDGIILLGYHAMAGTKNAVLEHSMSSKNIQNYYINGKKSGEIAIDAAIAGENGVPVIMVSGDDKACLEAKSLLNNVVTAQVKEGLGTYSAKLLPLETSLKVIYDKTIEAYKNIKNVKPYVLQKPITFKVEVTERTQLPNPITRPDVTIIDGRTFSVTANSMLSALYKSLI